MGMNNPRESELARLLAESDTPSRERLLSPDKLFGLQDGCDDGRWRAMWDLVGEDRDLDQEEELAEDLASVQAQQDAATCRATRIEAVQRARLTRTQRRVLLLLAEDGLSKADAARAMGKRLHAFRRILNRAIDRVKNGRSLT
jgi:DNA-directed RNA polymerase specialized sigma24 family protein